MIIEIGSQNQIILTLPSYFDSFGLQRIINYAKYLEATAKTKATQADVDKLADEVNMTWWENNRSRFIK